ncbi:hypothetical protein D3C84_876050 [compost metagenome]
MRDTDLALRNRANVRGAREQRRAAVEQVDVAIGLESFALEDIEGVLAIGVDAADAILRGLRQHRHIDRVLRHQIGEEGPALQATESLGLGVGQIEEMLAQRIPEGRPAFIVAVADDLGNHRVGKAPRMGGNEQQPRP